MAGAWLPRGAESRVVSTILHAGAETTAPSEPTGAVACLNRPRFLSLRLPSSPRPPLSPDDSNSSGYDGPQLGKRAAG